MSKDMVFFAKIIGVVILVGIVLRVYFNYADKKAAQEQATLLSANTSDFNPAFPGTE